MNHHKNYLLILPLLLIQPFFAQAFSIAEQEVGLGISPIFVFFLLFFFHFPYIVISFFYAVNAHRYSEKKHTDVKTGLGIFCLVNLFLFAIPVFQNIYAASSLVLFLIPSLYFLIGTLKTKLPFVNWMLSIFYVTNWMLLAMGGYENYQGYGPKAGEHKSYYDLAHTQIRSIENYAFGQRHGEYKEFQPNGNLSILVNYQYDTIYHVQEFHDNGQLKNEYGYAQDRMDGQYRSYYKSGQLETVSFFKLGLLDSTETVYFENGTVASLFRYKNGIREGECVNYFQNAQVKSTCQYKNGIGDYTSYYPTGELMESGRRNGDKKEGLWQSYFENGQLGSSGYYLASDYDNSIKHGLWKTYYPNGQLESVGEYEKGLRKGQWYKYFDTGEQSDTKDYGK